MFNGKRLRELEERTRELEMFRDSILDGRIGIVTPEYGRMPLRDAIRMVAAFMQRGTARRNGRRERK